jgi:CRP/FNR family transcriptional regulator, cyclic AMP receptor protein
MWTEIDKDTADQALRKIFSEECTTLEFDKGDYIIRPGEKPDGVYFIEKGFVKAYDISKYGEKNMLIVRKKSEIFPLIWAMTGDERDIVYESFASTTVKRIPRKIFLQSVRSNIPVLQSLLSMTLDMYRMHSERILNLEYRSVRERLMSFLMTTANRFGHTLKNGQVTLVLPLTHQDIAGSINTTRETTNRELSYLKRKKLIRVNKNGLIVIIDPAKMESLL